jgi:hypothetical protein
VAGACGGLPALIAVSPKKAAIGPVLSVPGPNGNWILSRCSGYELDPRDPRNAVITDILLAPRNARGMVEYVAGAGSFG